MSTSPIPDRIRGATNTSTTGTAPAAELPTPEKCIADFCLIPIGTATASVSAQIADVQRLLKRSGVEFSMHSGGTTLGAPWQTLMLNSYARAVEGPWDDVMRLIGQAHMIVHDKGVLRVQTDIRVGTRTDKSQSMADKVAAVEKLLAEDEAKEGKRKVA